MNERLNTELVIQQTRAEYAALREQYSALQREATRLCEALNEIAELNLTCGFYMCPGSDHPAVDMTTCTECYATIIARSALGEPAPECTGLECIPCGKESPWCDECDEKIIYCPHKPTEGT